MMDPLTILAALGPLAVDLGKSLIGRFIQTDTYKPVNVDEYVKMRQLDLDMFKAMNDAGGTNPSYPWVEAAVRLMRPAVALVRQDQRCHARSGQAGRCANRMGWRMENFS